MSLSLIPILFGVALLCFGILFFLNQKQKDSINDFYKVFTPNGLNFIRQLEELFDSNESLNFGDVVKLYQHQFRDMRTQTLDELERVLGISGWLDAPENTDLFIAGDYTQKLLGDLNDRYVEQFESLSMLPEKEAMDKLGINLGNNELAYYRKISNVDWYEEKKITQSYTYGGLQYKIGSGSGMSYRLGNLKVIPNTVQEFVHIDRGDLILTNKRLIFIGKEKRVNKSIDIDDILEFTLFRDGILIGKPNGKKPLIGFADYIQKPGKAPNKRDTLSRVMRLLERFVRNNYTEQIK